MMFRDAEFAAHRGFALHILPVDDMAKQGALDEHIPRRGVAILSDDLTEVMAPVLVPIQHHHAFDELRNRERVTRALDGAVLQITDFDDRERRREIVCPAGLVFVNIDARPVSAAAAFDRRAHLIVEILFGDFDGEVVDGIELDVVRGRAQAIAMHGDIIVHGHFHPTGSAQRLELHEKSRGMPMLSLVPGLLNNQREQLIGRHVTAGSCEHVENHCLKFFAGHDVLLMLIVCQSVSL